MWPRSRRASRIPSERTDSLVGLPDARYPIRGIFFGCWAWAREAVVRKKVASRRMAVLLFIAPPQLRAECRGMSAEYFLISNSVLSTRYSALLFDHSI